jgi:hypothetical protein
MLTRLDKSMHAGSKLNGLLAPIYELSLPRHRARRSPPAIQNFYQPAPLSAFRRAQH